MKRREIQRNFDQIVEFSGVEKFIDTPVKRFSSGMQVRLAFSVAAYLEPEILLVDEVLAVGDIQFQKKCLGRMRDISEGGRTVLFVSHNMSAIRNLCSRTIMLEGGKVFLDTDTETVVSEYLEQNLTAGAATSGKELEAKLEGVINRSNPTIRLREVRLFNEQDLPRSTFNSNETIKICLTYECLSIVKDLRIYICIVDEENRVIFASQNMDNANEVNFYQRNPGIYRSTCFIPENTFGEKRFFVSIHLINLKVEHLVLERVLGFNVFFQGYNNTQALKDSFIRPCLKWSTILVSDKIKENIYE